jgi:RimJ/RimL family protein N-acetyltransferase
MLTTARLTLKPQVQSDAPALLRILGDAEAMRFWNRPPITDMAVIEGLVEEQQAAMAAGLCRYWTLWEGGDAVGSIDLSLIENQSAELGFLVRRDRWGLGLASEACAAVVAHAFGALGLDRLAAGTNAGNAAARRVLEKTGFRLMEERPARLAGGALEPCAFYLRSR